MGRSKNPKVDLKRKYLKHFELGIILSLVIIIELFLHFPKISRIEVMIKDAQELVDVEDVVITKHETEPPPPPKPIVPLETNTDEVLEDIEIEDTDLDINEEVKTVEPRIFEEESEEGIEPTFFMVVEEMPSPIGGIAGIQSKIIYPEIAKRAGVQGRVFLKAYVDENGIVKKVEVLKGIGAGCDEAAIDAVMRTKFNPGKQRGKAVKVQVAIPIQFILTNV